MDGEADLEMPSPKRIRLEPSKLDIANDVPAQVDHMEDLSRTDPPRSGEHDAVSQINAQEQEMPIPATTPKTFHLPGLKLLNEERSVSNGCWKPDSNHKVKEAPEIMPQNGEGRSGSIEEESGKSGKDHEHGAKPEQKVAAATRESGFADPILLTGSSHRIEDVMEDVVTGTEAPQQRVPESMGETPTDQRLQEDTGGSLGSVAQEYTRSDTPTIHEESCAKDAEPDNNSEAQREVLQQGLHQEGDGGQKTNLETKVPANLESTSQTFEELAEANKSNAEAEFEIDSSPYESTSSDVSTDTSSSEDSGDDSDADDYEMLSPEEEARRLLAEDGGAEEKPTSGVLRTLNEKPDEVVPKPQVDVTADMKIEELGCVENVVENSALVKANTSGEYQVLESGSVLCLEDRSVIGVVAETLGRVQQPYYSVRFTNAAAIKEAGIVQSTKVFYVAHHSTTVFTQPLKAYKGSDASNLHDEEVGDDELEFSDDEAEAEHKRQVKLQKRARYEAKHGQEHGVLGAPQQRPRLPNNHPNGHLNAWPEHPPNPAEPSLNYDDAGADSDDLYTPLARPSNLHEIMARKGVPGEVHVSRGNGNRGSRGRGRGDRSGGRGGRGRGNERGGRHDRKGQNSFRGSGIPHAHPITGQQPSPSSQSNGFNPSSNHSLTAPPSHNSNDFHPQTQMQNSPMQPNSYPAHSPPQVHTNPSYAPQYPQTYNQPYPQYQQPQYPHQDPYLQGISRQGYFAQQSFSPGLAYPVQQAAPTPPSPAAIPPGAHINPTFFRQQGQHSSQSWWQGPASSPR